MAAAFFVWSGCAWADLPAVSNMREKQYNSYLIRIWQDDVPHDEGAISRLQGEVFHIQSGQFWRVHDFELLSDLLEDLMMKIEPAYRKED